MGSSEQRPLTVGQLDGTVGVHVSEAGDVPVAALTIELAAEGVR
jgi:hypothetical protein